jgi:hypothetical protein
MNTGMVKWLVCVFAVVFVTGAFAEIDSDGSYVGNFKIVFEKDNPRFSTLYWKDEEGVFQEIASGSCKNYYKAIAFLDTNFSVQSFIKDLYSNNVSIELFRLCCYFVDMALPSNITGFNLGISQEGVFENLSTSELLEWGKRFESNHFPFAVPELISDNFYCVDKDTYLFLGKVTLYESFDE